MGIVASNASQISDLQTFCLNWQKEKMMQWDGVQTVPVGFVVIRSLIYYWCPRQILKGIVIRQVGEF